MNAIIPQPSSANALNRYVQLPPSLKLLLRLKSLIVPAGTKSEFVECLRSTGSRTADGKAWSAISVNACCEELRRQNLMTSDQACEPDLVHLIAADAGSSDDAAMLAGAIRRLFRAQRSSAYYYLPSPLVMPESVHRLIRLAVYTNEETEFVQARDLYDKTRAPHRTVMVLADSFHAVPLRAEWIATRHPVIQALLLEARLISFIATGLPDPETAAIIALSRTLKAQDGFADMRVQLLRYDLLAGRIDDVRQGLETLQDTAGDTRQALEGAVAFLEGRDDEARTFYRDALKLYRKRIGKRAVYLPGEHGIFFLLAQLRASDAGLHAEIQLGLDTAMADRSEPMYAGFLAIQAMLWLVQGFQSKVADLSAGLSDIQSAGVLPAACIALAQHVVDPGISHKHRADITVRFERLSDVLPLIAGIYAEILAAIDPHHDRYTAWLARNPRVRFTTIVRIRQPWERALESLDVFLGSGTAGADTGKAPRKTRRLVWFVDPETEEVFPAEQSAKGRDGWTDGRPVAMKRLHEQDPRLDYLTPQDRLALRTIRKESTSGWHSEDSYYFDHPRTIAALVGHPAVFDARHRARALELVAYPLELLVTETSRGYRIALSHSADEATVFLEAETPSRYRVIEFPKKMLAVQEILGERGLTVPAAAREQVIAMVRRNSPALPIRAEIADVDQPGAEGQASPVVQLVPYDAGLKLTLLVRPFGVTGPAYVAGLGGRSILATVGGQQVRANRDLAREIAERVALVNDIPTLRDRGGSDAHELVVEDLEGCLELLLELRSYKGAVVVEWPEGRTMRVSAVDPGNMKLRVVQDRDWFSVDGSVALDEEQVLEMRFLLERLDRIQGRFVPLGDGRFVALTRQLQAQLQRLAAVSEPHKAGRRVHALGAPALDAVLEDAGEVRSDAAWKKHVARIRAAEGWTPVLPPTLRAELRDYQVEGFVWLSRLARWGAGACLADDMGLGKTVQAIAVMLDRAADGPCLVVAPTSVCPNWEAEIARFAPTLRTHRLAGTGDRAELVAGLGARDVLVCSYGMLGETLAGRDWQMVVLDEAQAIKNAETKRAQAVQALRAGFRLALTGTPVENYLDELWSLFGFVNPGVLGSREGFQKRFARPIERDKDPHARQALRALIKPFLLRRTKAAVLSELPPRTEQTLNVEMTEAERAFYEALRQCSLERIAALDAPEGRRKIQILAEITRLRRACCNPALIDAAAGIPSGKLAAFMELAEDLIRNRHRALVFSQFVGHLDLVRATLDSKRIKYEYLDGSTASAEREKRVASFQAGGADLFLISLRAGGTGLNLTAADYVVHLDPWWNPAVEDQASDRAHRIGQERPVTIYRLIMQDSIEEQILGLHRDKRDLATDLLEGAETTARLSEAALLDLIRA